MANIRLQNILRTRVDELVEKYNAQPSIAFIRLMLQQIFNLDEFEAEEAITDMAQDKGIDAIFELDEEGDNVLYVVQAKYFEKNYKKTIDENSKNLVTAAIENYILGDYPISNLNKRLRTKINEYRGRISKGKIDHIKMVFIINGQRPGQNIISELNKFKNEQAGHVSYEIYAEDTLLSIFSPLSTKAVEKIELKIIKDLGAGNKTLLNLPDIDIVQGKVVKVDICEMAEVVKNNPNIFNENVRAYQSIRNRVNQKIAEALRDKTLIKQFIYLNNGITLLCEDFDIKPGNESISIDKPSIINGCQTASTIVEIHKDGYIECNTGFVLVRIIKSKNFEIKRRIILSSNTQTAIRDRDLISEDDIQKELESQFNTMGYFYERKRGMHNDKPKEKIVDLEKAAQSYMALYLDRPAEAKSKKGEMYRSYYEQIFNEDLSANQSLVGYFLLAKFSDRIKEIRKGVTEFKRSFLGNSILHLLPLFKEWILKPQGVLLPDLEDDLHRVDDMFVGNADKVIKNLETAVNTIAKKQKNFNPQYFFKSSDSLQSLLNATKEKQDYVITMDLRKMKRQKDLRYYKPWEFSLDGTTFHPVKHWNTLFVKLINQYIEKNQAHEGNLEFINSGSRTLFLANPDADEKRMRKQTKNGLWLLTNFNSKYLSEFCSAIADKLEGDLIIKLRPTESRIKKTYKKRKYRRL